VKSDKLEIGRILQLKLEIRNFKLDDPKTVVRFKHSLAFRFVQSEISDF